ncbi:MAG: BspA family leucine-rich repeat surface protein [Fibrobacter sp.]|nr:BspA family leucine-rich repeat surface protein [Fibrobacter sp.]
MKKQLFLSIFLLFSGLAFADYEYPYNTSPMELVFDTRLHYEKKITLPLFGTVDVVVDWGDGAEIYINTPGYHARTYSKDTIYTIKIRGKLSEFGKDGIKQFTLVKVNSFGDLGITHLDYAFYNAKNLVDVPSDLPSTVTSLEGTFREAEKFNQNIDSWDVSKVTNMKATFSYALTFNRSLSSWDLTGVTNTGAMFQFATSFNQPIGNWEMGSVSNSSQMFQGAESFNQDISQWDMRNVERMDYMFQKAKAFNQPIGDWIVSNVESMSEMFNGAEAFNQPIGDWNVANVEYMSKLFRGAKNFNQPIGDWQVANVIYMDEMFYGATAFNQDIGNWSTESAESMNDMFADAVTFNQPIGGWDVSKVRRMSRMFQNAVEFSQDISDWNIKEVREMDDMFDGITIATEIYDNMLIKWDNINGKQFGVNFNAGNSSYTLGPASDAHAMISSSGWNITDAGMKHTPMKLLYNTELSPGTTIELSLFGNVEVSVDWGDGTTDTYSEAGLHSHTYAQEGEYTVAISGNLSQYGIGGADIPDYEQSKLTAVLDFGVLGVKSYSGAFRNATNLEEISIYLPPGVSDLSYMFAGATSFDQEIVNWKTSHVTNVEYMFAGATSFNQNIGSWYSFNIENMAYMFAGATSFNHESINYFRSEKVTNLEGVFAGASSFNQSLSYWDVDNVTNMKNMFAETPFDQDLGNWKVNQVTDMTDMFRNAGLSTRNYNNTLKRWSQLALQPGVVFNAGHSQLISSTLDFKQKIIDDFNWIISDGGEQAPMVLLYKAEESEYNCIALPLYGEVFALIDWGDHNHSQATWSGEHYHCYEKEGEYIVSISGTVTEYGVDNDFYPDPGDDGPVAFSLNFFVADEEYDAFEGYKQSGLLKVLTFGEMPLTSISGAFRGAENLISVPDTLPATVNNMNYAFYGATAFNQDLSSWDVSNVQEMAGLFQKASSFDQDLSSWDVSNVWNMDDFFAGVKLSTHNYDKLLQSWSKQDLQNGVFFDAGQSQYSAGLASIARQKLIDEFSWYVIDEGEDPLSENEPGEGEGEDEPGENEGEDEPGENEGEDEPGENEGEDEPGENEGEDEPGEGEGEDEPGENEGEKPTVLLSQNALYPAKASFNAPGTHIQLQNAESVRSISLHSIKGKLILQKSVHNAKLVAVPKLSQSFYVIKLRYHDGKTQSLLINN